MNEPLRLCLDLNVFIATFLSQAEGRETASRFLVDAVGRGMTPSGRPVQLVTAWSMLTRLHAVLVDRLGVSPVAAEMRIQAIRAIAQMGPCLEPPYVVLGGTGLVPIRDDEDSHVIDTALAGRADILITRNLKDFRPACQQVADKVLRHRSGHGTLVIASPQVVAGWLRLNQIPDFTAALPTS